MPTDNQLAQTRAQIARRVQLTMLRTEAELENGACHTLRAVAALIEARSEAQLRTRDAGKIIATLREGMQLSLDAVQRFWDSHHALEVLADEIGMPAYGPDEGKVPFMQIIAQEAA